MSYQNNIGGGQNERQSQRSIDADNFSKYLF